MEKPSSMLRPRSPWDGLRAAALRVEVAGENALLVLMVLVVFVQVGMRYFFNASLDWAEELSRIAFVWLVFLGAMTALRRGAHLGVDVLVRLLPARLAVWTGRIARLCVAATLLLFLYYGVLLSAGGYIVRTPVLGIPWTYIYAVVPISALGMLLQLLLGSPARTGQPAQGAAE